MLYLNCNYVWQLLQFGSFFLPDKSVKEWFFFHRQTRPSLDLRLLFYVAKSLEKCGSQVSPVQKRKRVNESSICFCFFSIFYREDRTTGPVYWASDPFLQEFPRSAVELQQVESGLTLLGAVMSSSDFSGLLQRAEELASGRNMTIYQQKYLVYVRNCQCFFFDDFSAIPSKYGPKFWVRRKFWLSWVKILAQMGYICKVFAWFGLS